MKTCTACGASKDESEFRPTTTRRGDYVWTGLRAQCRECERASWRKPRELLKLNMPYTNPETGQRVKRCTQCRQEFPTEAFSTPGLKGCLRGRCRPCETTYQREWRALDPARTCAYTKAYAIRHPERVKARMISWRARNRAHVEQYQRTYNETHREQKRTTYRRHYHSLPPEERRERRRRWDTTGMANGRIHAALARRRAREIGAIRTERVARADIVKRDGSTCYLCGKELSRHEITLDHVVPLARGGSHTADNLRVACRSCNSHKGTRLLHELGLVVSG